MSYLTKKLGELCEILLGGTPSRNNKDYFGGSNLWCSIADMKTKIISDTKEKITDDGVRKSNVKLLKEGTLFMSFKLSLGKLAFAGKDLYTNEAIAGLPIKNQNELDKNFLYYILSGYDFSILGTDNSVKGATLNKSKLEILPIPLPPLPIQKLIVQKLDSSFEKIDKSIEITKKNLKNLEQLNKSVLEEVFREGGFGVKGLGEIFDVTSSKRIYEADYVESGIPFYRSKEIILKSKKETIKNTLYITEKKFLNIKEKFGAPKEGDILITSVGTLGVVYLVKDEEDFYFKDGNLIWFKNLGLSIIYGEYLIYWFKSNNAIQQINKSTIGSTQKALTIISVKKYQIPLPPLPKQKEIVTYLDKIFEKNKSLKSEYERKLKDLEEMKQSLLKEAFEGRLVKE